MMQNDNMIEFISAYDENGDFYSAIRDASGREIRIRKSVEEATIGTDQWKRDSVSVPGPYGLISSFIDWEIIHIGGDSRTYITSNETNPLDRCR